MESFLSRVRGLSVFLFTLNTRTYWFKSVLREVKLKFIGLLSNEGQEIINCRSLIRTRNF